MKRIEEKVKDIVEVRPFTQLHDFAADPARTLDSYHFTDITADLMANWIGRVTQCKKHNGMAVALAGFRGVGKSHFLSTFAAIVSQPEFRSRISDEHVTTVSQGLLRRHFNVAFVRRGSGADLVEELKKAVSGAVGISVDALGDSPRSVLEKAGEQTGDMPLILLFDTAAGRESRVTRDDGTILSEIAIASRELGFFVGIALDDDISGADGPNSAIASNYVIDYLDPEHLFKIVDAHIFSKNNSKHALLREIYEHFRASLPGFRWSELRFAALYPLHPATLEIAPLIRLYIQDFALLGFASEAGLKILGRPADSLIGLDEMFDSVESKLRNVSDLNSAFAAFDQLEQSVIAKAPIQARLQAKLILKGLFLLSLDGQGASIDDIAAGMMIFSDGHSKVNVEGWLKAFAESFPETVTTSEVNGKYCFRISDSDDINSYLEEAAANISDDVVWNLLLRQTAERCVDIATTGDFGSKPTPSRFEWRGAVRQGEIVWDPETYQTSEGKLDWVINVERKSIPLLGAEIDGPCPTLSWNLAVPTEDEKNIIRRFHLLQTSPELREQYRNSHATAVQIHSIALERIWQRVFISNSYISYGNEVYLFSEDIGRANSLTQILNTTLEPFFNDYYPLHPEFKSLLTEDRTAFLVANFFGAGAVESIETQTYAAAYALPMGLAVRDGEKLVPAPTDALANLDYVSNLLESEGDENKILPISSISSLLRLAPLGLTKESQRLVLASLVAQRQFEFVTTSGNRINHRSLDLQIIWNDIEGIARPKADAYSGDQLLSWARLLTSNNDLSSLDKDDDRLLIADALINWLNEWNSDGALAKFDVLPDEFLNTTIWRVAIGLKRSFGEVAAITESHLSGKISIEDCLRNIADLFSDSEDEYLREKNELNDLVRYIILSERRRAAVYYVVSSEWTCVAEIDSIRRELLMMLTSSSISFNTENSKFDDLWTRYQELYSAHYVEKHEAAMNVFASGQTLKEMMASEMWSTFQVITELPLIDRRFAEHAMALIREIRAAVCKANVRDQLMIKPVCTCTNQFEDLERLTQLFDELRNIVERATDSFKKLMIDNKESVISTGKKKFPGWNIEFLLDGFENADTFPSVSAADLRLLKIVCSDLPIQAEIMMEHLPTDEVIEAVLEADAVRWVDEPDAESVPLNFG